MKRYFSLLTFIFLAGCANQHTTAKSNPAGNYIASSTGFKYQVIKKGSGVPAREGQEVLIFETTTYLDGTVLYSNENSTSPVKVLIGGHQATEGVDEGLRGMQKGEIRQLIAPPNLVKRKFYPSNLSPDSTLAIKIILHKIL